MAVAGLISPMTDGGSSSSMTIWSAISLRCISTFLGKSKAIRTRSPLTDAMRTTPMGFCGSPMTTSSPSLLVITSIPCSKLLVAIVGRCVLCEYITEKVFGKGNCCKVCVEGELRRFVGLCMPGMEGVWCVWGGGKGVLMFVGWVRTGWCPGRVPRRR